MVRKSKILRMFLSTLFVLSAVLCLTGCGEQPSGQGGDNGQGSAAAVEEEHGTAPAFEVDPLVISPVQAFAGEEITVSTTVRNVGNTAGVCAAEFLVNQHVIETRDVSVAGGGSQAISFTVSRTDPGVYDVSLGGRLGSFAILAPNTAPAFALDPLTVTPSAALSGDNVTISTTLRNNGNGAGIYSAELVINGHTVEAKDVAVADGGSVPLAFRVSETHAGVYDVSIGDRSASFSVTAPTIAPLFLLDPLTISPAEVYSGDNVTITTTIRNTGNADGVYTATLVFDDHTIETRDVTVSSGGSQPLTFTVSRTEPGIYDVSIGDRSGSFTVSHPPLNLQLDYIGVKCADPEGTTGQGNIRLVVYVADGLEEDTETRWIPLEVADPYPMEDFETKDIGQQLFRTGSVGNYLKVTFIALRENEKPVSSDFLTTLGTMFGTLLNPAVGGTVGGAVGAFLDEMRENNSQYAQYTYIGSYQRTWTADDGWGTNGDGSGKGRYDQVGDDDLRVWFRIWSDSEPQEVAPPVLLPDVTIQDVTVPALAEVDKTFDYTVVLKNNESHPVKVRLSEITPYGYWAKTVTIDALSSTPPIPHSIVAETAREVGVMLTVHKPNGDVICQTYRTVEARDRFAGWYVGGTNVTTATVGTTITARINVFNLAPGWYTFRILRDVSWAPDEEVARVSFYYDGTPTTQDLSFVPLYANGYHLGLSRDGTTVWAQKNEFPPRLRVTA